MNRWSLGAAVAVMALAGCGGSGSGAPFGAAATEPAPKNILFFLGDGMGLTTMTAARIYKVGEDGELTMDTLPETAFVKTFSANAQVTDSAPSMSAYMTGVKMNNEVISMSAETSAYDPVTLKDYLAGADTACPASGNGNRFVNRQRIRTTPAPGRAGIASIAQPQGCGAYRRTTTQRGGLPASGAGQSRLVSHACIGQCVCGCPCG